VKRADLRQVVVDDGDVHEQPRQRCFDDFLGDGSGHWDAFGAVVALEVSGFALLFDSSKAIATSVLMTLAFCADDACQSLAFGDELGKINSEGGEKNKQETNRWRDNGAADAGKNLLLYRMGDRLVGLEAVNVHLVTAAGCFDRRLLVSVRLVDCL